MKEGVITVFMHMVATLISTYPLLSAFYIITYDYQGVIEALFSSLTGKHCSQVVDTCSATPR